MNNVIYYCQNTTARQQVIEQLLDVSTTVRDIRIKTLTPGFSIQAYVDDTTHQAVLTHCFGVTYEFVA